MSQYENPDSRFRSPQVDRVVGVQGSNLTPGKREDGVSFSSQPNSAIRSTTMRQDHKYFNTNQTQRRSQIFDASKYVCKELDADEVISLREVFTRWDQDGNGTLSPLEMKLAVMQYDKNVTQQQIIAIFSTLDQQGTGGIDFDAFVSIFKQKTISDSIERMYNQYDVEKKGHISLQDLTNFTQRKLKIKEDESVLRDIISIAGTDNKISKQQFIKIMNDYYSSLRAPQF